MPKLIKVCKAGCICWIKALYKCKVWQTDWLIELDKIDIVWHAKVVWMPEDIIWKIQNTEVNEVWAELSHIRCPNQRDSRFSYTAIQTQRNSKVCPFLLSYLICWSYRGKHYEKLVSFTACASQNSSLCTVLENVQCFLFHGHSISLFLWYFIILLWREWWFQLWNVNFTYGADGAYRIIKYALHNAIYNSQLCI